MYSALTVASYIIKKCNELNTAISNLKLQKILYFLQAEYLVARNRPCFYDIIEAWDFGPVVPIVYREYRIYGSASIPSPKNYICNEMIYACDEDLFDGVINFFSQYSAAALVEITHRQQPWIKAYEKGRNSEITIDSIKDFFSEGIGHDL